MRIISIVKPKWYITYIWIFCIVIYKFHNKQESYLVILLPVDKSLEVYFHYAVLSLNLAVYLWIKDGEKLSFDAKKVA